MTHTKKELMSSRSQAPIAIQSDLHCTRNRPFVSTEIIRRTVTTETVIEERSFVVARPVCDCCGYIKEQVAVTTPRGVTYTLWVCPNCDPGDPASAIPLREEGKKLIDVKPIRRAA